MSHNNISHIHNNAANQDTLKDHQSLISDESTDLSSHISTPQENQGENHWRILLIELVHLLGLFLSHARYAKGTRATEVLFEQFMRYLHLLEKKPGHDQGMIIRYCGRDLEKSAASEKDYMVLFGDLIIQGADLQSGSGLVQEQRSHLANALGQALDCLLEQGIYALYLQLPDNKPEKIKQLHLALNIIARFQYAVENNATITFHYFGRAMSVPLVRDSNGLPNVNLTLVAGLNSLSSANARELVRQAEAFCKLSDRQKRQMYPIKSYDQIFSVRSLRAQLIRPPIEINHMPWMQVNLPDYLTVNHKIQLDKKSSNPPKAEPESDQTTALASSEQVIDKHFQSSDEIPAWTDFDPSALTFDYFAGQLAASDGRLIKTLETLWVEDFSVITPKDFAARLASATQLLQTIEQQSMGKIVAESLLRILHRRLEQVPEAIILDLTVQRHGVKIVYQDRSFLIGMVHSRLLELILLVKEQVTTRHKIAAVHGQAFDFESFDYEKWSQHFEISVPDVEHIMSLLKGCFSTHGNFNRQEFENQIEHIAANENSIFEILWCYLKQTPQGDDRLAFLNAMQLLMVRLNQPKQSLRFLLADFCLNPFQVDYSDRNALVLANVLLRTRNQELQINTDSTSEEVLKIQNNLNFEIIRYALWRLDIDQVRILTKIRTIRDLLKKQIQTSIEEDDFSFHFLLALEREVFIFLALVGGKTARMILRGAIAHYGDPGSVFYAAQPDLSYISLLISHLRVAVRGLGRIGRGGKDLDYLKQLKRSADRLSEVFQDSEQRFKARQIVEWAVHSIKNIQVRGH